MNDKTKRTAWICIKYCPLTLVEITCSINWDTTRIHWSICMSSILQTSLVFIGYVNAEMYSVALIIINQLCVTEKVYATLEFWVTNVTKLAKVSFQRNRWVLNLYERKCNLIAERIFCLTLRYVYDAGRGQVFTLQQRPHVHQKFRKLIHQSNQMERNVGVCGSTLGESQHCIWGELSRFTWI